MDEPGILKSKPDEVHASSLVLKLDNQRGDYSGTKLYLDEGGDGRKGLGGSSSNFATMATTLFRNPSATVFTGIQFPVSISIQSYTADGTQSVSKTTEKNEFDGNQVEEEKKKKLRVLVTGGGIGGLVFALAAKRKGFDVVVFEKDLNVIRVRLVHGRGPIQIQSNALAALEAIDMEAAEEVMEAGCITGDKINGLVDGVSGTWYIKFDTFIPAAERELPVTRVISRMTLQEILAQAVGEDVIFNESNVVDFEDDGNKVIVALENGNRYEGDLLVGADGIWSEVPCNFGTSSTFFPRMLELERCSGKRERLLEIFDGWCDNVIDLLVATAEDAILRRDIYDRTPSLTWGRERDSYQLALELDKAWNESVDYERARKLRVAIIHGMARMAAIMASTYKAYLGLGLGPLSFLTKFRIPHPGRVGGRFFIDLAMPVMHSWVLGGNSTKLEGRSLNCRLSDKASDQLRTWFEDNDALERTIIGDWYLLPVGNEAVTSQPTCLSRDENKTFMIGFVFVHNRSEKSDKFPETSIVLPSNQVSKMHAQISYKDGAFFIVDLQIEDGTFIDHGGRRSRVLPNVPTRLRPSDVIEFCSDHKVAVRVKVMRSHPKMAEKGAGGILQAV
ncbi:Zeaxanthin epoxidase [Hibiscus syriacus]|uniref:Zeaxanthin epoxidase n=1 Tax=Hibiscus syriacus TaxID=106335 RepID=A0A6A2XP20_HIBSY|nr:Zeaxanthin epoxidase [Hibiscus syriacus]